MGRRPLRKRLACANLSGPGLKPRAPHAVLAVLSDCYSPLSGRSPTCYAPIRHSARPCGPTAFDLHVLSTPPAFILSQDQTLRKKLRDTTSSVRRSFVGQLSCLSDPIGPPTHRQTVQALLTTGVASYHSSVVKVLAPSFPWRQSGRTLPHSPAPCQDRRKTDASCSLHRPRGVAPLSFVWFRPPKRAKHLTGNIIDT